MKINDRISWAVEVLAIKPNDHIFEIGCGSGIAIELIAEKLSLGIITAVDQSVVMIRMACKRNAEWIAAKKAVLHAVSFMDIRLGVVRFNKIFAFNVNLFWTSNPAKELQKIKGHLKPDGLFYLFYQLPGGSTKEVEILSRHLQEQAFEIVQLIFKKELTAFCIVSKSAGN